MTNLLPPRLRPLLLLLALAAPACGDDDTGAGGKATTTSTGATPTTNSTGVDAFPQCKKGTLEGDMTVDAPLNGPGVDPATGTLAPGSYFVAATYLAMEPGEVQRAQMLGGKVVESLATTEGLVAFSLAGSQSCVSLRTLTVWRSEEDMLAFVISPAHATAMSQTSTLSRGTSNTISWAGDEKTATWAEAATRLGNETKGDQ